MLCTSGKVFKSANVTLRLPSAASLHPEKQPPMRIKQVICHKIRTMMFLSANTIVEFSE
jgi:hypothetical protein